MHKIAVNIIAKDEKSCYEQISYDLIKNARKYAQIELNFLFNKKIHQAQKAYNAKEEYRRAFIPKLLKDGYNIALHPEGEMLDSYQFSGLFKNSQKLAFFIAGAFGFDEEFLRMCDKKVSLAPLTFSHKIAQIVLLEQIFRGLSILHKHPYHK